MPKKLPLSEEILHTFHRFCFARILQPFGVMHIGLILCVQFKNCNEQNQNRQQQPQQTRQQTREESRQQILCQTTLTHRLLERVIQIHNCKNQRCRPHLW